MGGLAGLLNEDPLFRVIKEEAHRVLLGYVIDGALGEPMLLRLGQLAARKALAVEANAGGRAVFRHRQTVHRVVRAL